MQINNRRGLLRTFMCGTLLLGINQASAYTPMGQQIESFCANSGYTLLPEYANDTCDAACHDNTEGQTAYDNGDFEYFCPPEVTPEPTCTDADGDGYFAEGGDCGTPADFNDNSSAAYPGAAETCGDGIDNDGNGLTDEADPNASGCSAECTDLDGDGYNIDGDQCGPIDCNDDDPAINPGAEEICDDGIDNNCNGLVDTADMNAVNCPLTCTDEDGDGYSTEGGSCGAKDCNDEDETIHPGALEICDDGIDNNCDNRADDADKVCQDNGPKDDDRDEKPWWRKRHKHDKHECDRHRSKDRECGRHERDDDDDDENKCSRGDRDDKRGSRSKREHDDD